MEIQEKYEQFGVGNAMISGVLSKVHETTIKLASGINPDKIKVLFYFLFFFLIFLFFNKTIQLDNSNLISFYISIFKGK